MNRDPEKLCAVSEAEIAYDRERGVDVESIQSRIELECEGLENHDWVHEKGRDPVEFQLECARIAFATDSLTREEKYEERFYMLRDLVRKEFKFYAEKAALREAQQVAEEAPY